MYIFRAIYFIDIMPGRSAVLPLNSSTPNTSKRGRPFPELGLVRS